MYARLQDEGQMNYATDSIHVRFIPNPAADEWYRSMLTLFGFNPNPTVTTRAKIKAGEFGVPTGPMP